MSPASATRSTPTGTTSRCSGHPAHAGGVGGSRAIISHGTSRSCTGRSSRSRSSSAPGRHVPGARSGRLRRDSGRCRARRMRLARSSSCSTGGSVGASCSRPSRSRTTSRRTPPSCARSTVSAFPRPTFRQLRSDVCSELLRTYLANHPEPIAGDAFARIQRAGIESHMGSAGREHAPRCPAVLPSARSDVPPRVRQLTERRNPHPQRLARFRARLRTPFALGGTA